MYITLSLVELELPSEGYNFLEMVLSVGKYIFMIAQLLLSDMEA